MSRNSWKENLNSEIEFWDSWINTKGLQWKEDYIYRIDPNSETVGLIKTVLDKFNIDSNYKILDVGAGPLTILGKYHKGVKLNITAVDALATTFSGLSWGDYKPSVVTEYCETERLDEKFNCDYFDLVYARNTIDHHYDAPLALRKILDVTKKQGLIVLSHAENEAIEHNWGGLHKWNFYIKDGDLKLSNQQTSMSLIDIMNGSCEILFLNKNAENVIDVIIRKK